MLAGDALSVTRARKLRSEMTLLEVKLWLALRQRPAGMKFRRQHPAGAYVADFYCHEARLIIEVDGEAHARGDRPLRDAVRDAHFEQRGLHVLRFPATAVLSDSEAVVATIVAQAQTLTPLRPFGPPPLAGEDDVKSSPARGGDSPRSGGGRGVPLSLQIHPATSRSA